MAVHAHADRRPLGPAAIEELGCVGVRAVDQQPRVTDVDRLDRSGHGGGRTTSFSLAPNSTASETGVLWHDDQGQWYRTHGNEHWEFDDDRLMRRRDMSANDIPNEESERCNR